jgi:hypothetical protein
MSDTSAAPAALPVAPCPHCGREVPTANFCGACGAHLASGPGPGSRRHHAYAAFPEEPVLRLAVTSSLFPHLSHHAKTTFRAAIGALVVVLVALALGGVQAPAIAVSALGVPLLYLLYTYEIDDPTRTRLVRTVPFVLVPGVGLGIGWGLVGGHYVNEALGATLDFSLVRPAALAGAVAVPAVAVLLMVLPILAARWRARDLDEALDGFVLGALGALCFVAAATITQLSSLFSVGQLSAQSFTGILAQVVIRGLCSPILAAALIGLFGSAVWVAVRGDAPAGRRWLGTPLVPLVAALVLEIGLGFADVARLSDPVLLLVHLAAVGVALAVMRVGLHYVLLHEAGTSLVGEPSVCGHCHFVVARMHFCPHCGVAWRATARSHPARRATSPAGGAGEGTGATEHVPRQPWPTVPAGALGTPLRAAFAASPAPRRTVRLRQHHLYGALGLGLLALSGILVLVVFLERSPAPAPCPQLFKCGGPVAGDAVHNGTTYTSSEFGFSLEYGPNSGVQRSAQGIIVTYAADNQSQQGSVEIAGVRAEGVSASALVGDVAQQIAPSATPEYAVPNPFVGDVAAAGEAYDVEPNGSSNSTGLERLIVLAAVRGNLAIVVADLGPYWRFSSSNATEMSLNDHPSPADQFAALFADPEVNSVVWPAGG